LNELLGNLQGSVKGDGRDGDDGKEPTAYAQMRDMNTLLDKESKDFVVHLEEERQSLMFAEQEMTRIQNCRRI
jgi:hypothetical protein